MSGIFATAGAAIDIGQTMTAQSADFVEADFSGNSWVNIAWPESIGEFGDEAAEITFDAISEARTQKLKGTRNAGTMQCVFGVDTTDEGQLAVVAAEKTTNDYGFRLTFDDNAVSAGATDSIRYFIAKVMSAREVGDTANNVVKMNVALAINSNIVRVDG